MIKRGIDPDNLFSQYRLNYLVLKAVLLRWTMSTDSMSETILSFHVSYTQAMSYLLLFDFQPVMPPGHHFNSGRG